MLESTRKCPICGRPYKVYGYSAADQSACPHCVREAERAVDKSVPTKHPWWAKNGKDLY